MAPCRASPRNSWDEEQRTVLHLLVQRADLSWSEKAHIFNQIFDKHLRQHGYINGLPITTLNIQYYESKKEARANVWQPILAPLSAEKVKYQAALSEQIEQQQRVCTTLDPARSTVRARASTASSLAVKVSQRDHCQKIQKTHVYRKSTAVPSAATATPPRSRPVHIPSRSQLAHPKVSPQGHRIRRGEEATIPFPRRMGATLTLTATEFAAAQTELIPVPWETAHPPLTGLVFRYWHNKSSGYNSATDGFIAGRYMFTNVVPPSPPQCEKFNAWSDVFGHLNGDQIASPYVSLSNSFAWTCRQALGQSERGQTNVRITVIDASTLDRETVFHAKPYHKEIRKKYAFTDGAHRYPATYELLVWHEIPQQAILGTFTIQDLLSLERKDASVATALRLRELSEQNRGYRTTILPRWIAEEVGLEDGIIRTLAELCNFAKVNVSSIDHICYVVSEYITGWGIAKSPLTAEQWLKQANQFAEAFIQLRSLSASLPFLSTLMTGYLFGVQLSCGDANTLFRPSTARLMRKRAKVIGLEDPAAIVAQYFHDSLSAVFCHDNLHRRLLDLPPTDVQVRDRLQEFRANVDFRGRPNIA